jgi:hypothetical protein
MAFLGGAVTEKIPDAAARAQEYRESVISYEKLDAEIDALLSSHAGASRNLSDVEYVRYRELVDLRDLAYNRMKTLELSLLDE